ncbi:DUF5672 family protein [Caballeronia insecticola]|uniref:Glycosyl transferase family 17 n=1 Tax=Caballeronia insecticola TaxID=758793 RepID=R4WZ29_9BURK|nr:DUF5672 family protein [Caballeronia insecticola]BAN23602.1 glycosyl transferase family 17 [Caballeronia insecticola]
MPHNRFNRVTIVSVTGLSDTRGAVAALAVSLRNMPGARALLCSPEAPPDLPPGVAHVRITPLTYVEYSWFILFALWRVIETDYALIVQDDGWVLDGANWRDEYFEYDYIGAPCHQALVETSEGSQAMRSFSWYGLLDRPEYKVWHVQNGGFSLRSQRLLRAFVDHPHIKVQLPTPEVSGDPLRLHWTHSDINEDVQLTLILRSPLEAVGIRFAPMALALQFAMEGGGAPHHGMDLMQLFGHHSSWRRLVSADPPTVCHKLSQAMVENHPIERLMVNTLRARGYRIEFAPAEQGGAA